MSEGVRGGVTWGRDWKAQRMGVAVRLVRNGHTDLPAGRTGLTQTLRWRREDLRLATHPREKC